MGKAAKKRKHTTVETVVPISRPPSSAKIALATENVIRRSKAKRRAETVNPFAIHAKMFPPGVEPGNGMAMDANQDVAPINAWAASLISSTLMEGQAFLGYPLLAEMAQRPEYRRMVEVVAGHMTRKWITFKSKAAEEAKAKAKAEGKTVVPPAPKPAFPLGAGMTGAPPSPTPPKPFGGAADALPPAFAAKTTPPAPNLQGPAQSPTPPALQPPDAAHTQPGQAPFGIGHNMPPPDQVEVDDKSDKIGDLVDHMEKFRVQHVVHKALELDGFFGRGHIFIDTGDEDDRDELKTPIGNGMNAISRAKIAPGSLKALRAVEPVWAYPTRYNSNNPLRADWYKPDNWMVMGLEVHASRFLTIIGREVPDLLKPAYAFGGLSMTQMAKPYVDNWLQTRQSVADIVKSFSTFVLSMDLVENLMMDQGEKLFRRAEMFNNLKDNQGLLMIDKKGEEFENVSAPLGTLDQLQAQSQEHMASVHGIPIVVLLGIQPAGLNASSEGELTAFNDTINEAQERVLRDPLTVLVHFMMLDLWGEVDPDIVFDFAPLESLDPKDQAQKDLVDAQTDAEYVQMGAIDASEVRKKLINDPDSPYQGLPDEPPGPDPGELAAAMMGGMGMPGAPPGPGQPPKPGEQGPAISKPKLPGVGGAPDPQAADAALDAGWNEEQHPRGQPENKGEFASAPGGGGSKPEGPAAPAQAAPHAQERTEGRRSSTKTETRAGEAPTGSEHAAEIKSLYERVSKPDGGFTYQPTTDDEPKEGFAVSPYPERSFAKPAAEFSSNDLVDYIVKNRDLFADPEHYLGGWNDPESGKVFLDISVVKHDQAEAEKLAREKDQIAIFDLGSFNTITVNREATSGGQVNKPDGG